MGAFIFSEAAGRIARYADLPNANDAILAILLKSAGLEADGTLRDYQTLSALLAAANDEADFAGYARQTLTGVTVTFDAANNRNDIDANDPSWSPTAAQALGKIVFAYDPDTTGGTDATVIPLFADDYVLTTPTSGTISYSVAAGAFGRATAS